MRRPVVRAATAAALLVTLCTAAEGLFVNTSVPVPKDRIERNLTRLLEKRPKDGRLHYLLGRIHAMTFASPVDTLHLEMPDGEDGAPRLPPWTELVERQRPAELTAEKRRHLTRGNHHLALGARLAPDDAIHHLGQAFLLDLGSPFAGEIGWPDGAERKSGLPGDERQRYEAWIEQLEDPARHDAAFDALARALPRAMHVLVRWKEHPVPARRADVARLLERGWRREALDAYRKAYEKARAGDLRKEFFGPGQQGSVALEAAGGILRLLELLAPTDEVRKERARVEQTAKTLKAKGSFITPIVFPVDGDLPLAALVDDDAEVRFDLDGDGVAGTWPWVRANTGILVWIPEGPDADVRSGRRLFGSATWWMPWRDGYEPLAALDDDGDGSLAGRELDGIGVWVDADGDARSDPGEVRTAAAAGLRSIATAPDHAHDGVPARRSGLQMADGTSRPTYDWTPRRREGAP